MDSGNKRVKPHLSIIIPAYNSAATLPALLRSIINSQLKNIETIIVDDGSTDKTKEIIKKFPQIRYFSINHQGPGGARNFGARKAKSDILVFFDSDVVLYADTLRIILKAFTDKKTIAITGIWDKDQKNTDFFPRYKALRDWCYWFFEDAGKQYAHVFSPRVAAIRKKVFLEFGGFDDSQSHVNALEEFGFTYRLTGKYKIKFLPNLRVHHEFGSFKSMAVRFFKRSFSYAKVFLKYKRFNRNGYTPNEGLAGLVMVLALFSFSLSFWFSHLLYAALLLLTVHLYLERKFFAFALKEEGFIFTFKSVFAGLIVYLIVYSAMTASIFHSLFIKDKKS
ncbi:hypothetical protein A3J78_00330 [Candidatus Beckwithbacteria bacterium RBG_13_35_6]|uniref:Glycosyltransferase 2-like domain-containing protein n=1 Tax=Candidatus Beckwithbacteria bacterium RBG_13_35_6 TaxID=1797456 RepID=A0A1F5DHY5_9BACT|nr:MAG: hypothetical protein A3J78_00330 [Candidatus Beckwithbacteria bacterium RBG_13_35_6]